MAPKSKKTPPKENEEGKVEKRRRKVVVGVIHEEFSLKWAFALVKSGQLKQN
jgi:hypothetical protein